MNPDCFNKLGTRSLTSRAGQVNKLSYALLTAVLILGVPTIGTALLIDGPTTEWTPIYYPGLNFPDPADDQQTGNHEGDLVGDIDNASFFSQFDDNGTPTLSDDTLAFRTRHGRDKNPPGFSTALFVGMDADLDGDLDIFVGVHNSGSADEVGIWAAGAGLNVSPSTTTLSGPDASYPETASNYSWDPVDATIDPLATTFDVDGLGHNDYMLSFSIPFSDLVAQLNLQGIILTTETPVRYVMASATQDNSLNQDLNGVDGQVNSDLTWEELGATSDPYTSSGDRLPEPSTLLLLLVAAPVLGVRVRRR